MGDHVCYLVAVLLVLDAGNRTGVEGLGALAPVVKGPGLGVVHLVVAWPVGSGQVEA